MLSKVQRLFLNSLLVVRNCPSALMLWDLGMITMSLRILEEKLLFYHHVSSLTSTSLVRQVLKNTRTFQFSILEEGNIKVSRKFEVDDVKSFTKEKWKQFVNCSILQLNRDQLIEEMKSMKKLDYIELSLEDFKLKDYFSELNLDLSCIKFRSRSLTMTSCATHYPSDEKLIKSGFECKNSCGNIDGLIQVL